MAIYPTKPRVAVFVLAVCVITLSGICCSAVRRWRSATREASEATLRSNLATIRDEIRTYAINRRELPQTLNDLDLAGSGSFKLPDPITGRADWQVTIGEDPALVKGKRGVINVHSASTAISSEGTPYNTW
jgi:hypothetical protein